MGETYDGMDPDVVCKSHLWSVPNKSAVYDTLSTFYTTYHDVHVYLSVLIGALATVCNLCNILVLTRRPMRTPVNTILCAIAVCDISVLLTNLVFAAHWNFRALRRCDANDWSFLWAVYFIVYANLSQVGHTTSVWLSVAMAFLRYLTLRSRSQGSTRITMTHGMISIGAVLTSVAILNLPNCLMYTVRRVRLEQVCNLPHLLQVPQHANDSAYITFVAPISLGNNCLIFKMTFWITGVVFKLLPCLMLTVFIVLLVRILTDFQKRRARLRLDPSVPVGSPDRKPLRKKRDIPSDRTTQMLIAIVCVFLVCELPQGVMAVLSGLFNQDFRANVYNNLGDLIDMLSLINSGATFVIYCTMSAQFRQEFSRVFLPRCCSERFGDGRPNRRQSDPPTVGGYLSTAFNGNNHKLKTLNSNTPSPSMIIRRAVTASPKRHLGPGVDGRSVGSTSNLLTPLTAASPRTPDNSDTSELITLWTDTHPEEKKLMVDADKHNGAMSVANDNNNAVTRNGINTASIRPIILEKITPKQPSPPSARLDPVLSEERTSSDSDVLVTERIVCL